MKSKNTKYLIRGYYGFGNLGDELMLKVIVRRIRNVHPDAPIYVICKYAPRVKDILPVRKSVGLPIVTQITYFCRLLVTILKVDKLIIGGGTLFLDRGKHNLHMLVLSMVIFLSKIFSKKTYVVGVGIDKITYPMNVRYLKYILENSEFVSVRDNFSFNVANNLIGKSIVKKTSDIVFDSGFVKSLQTCKSSEKKFIVLALFDYNRIWGSIEKEKLFREHSLQLIVNILKKWGSEYKIALCAFQYKKGGCDYEFLADLHSSIMTDYPIFADRLIVKYLDKEDQIKEYIGQAVFAISNRYHALVLCAILGVPFMGIQTGMKINEICNEFSMPFIKESEYIERGIGIHKLDALKTMTIKEEVVVQSMEGAEGNFVWIR